jgi:hypothetical protein
MLPVTDQAMASRTYTFAGTWHCYTGFFFFSYTILCLSSRPLTNKWGVDDDFMITATQTPPPTYSFLMSNLRHQP